MKIERIAIRNTIGLRYMDIELRTPLTVFAGSNGAGKTSIAQAIRLALVAEPSRVVLKKDFDKLITEGAESAGIQIEAGGAAYTIGISAAGKVIDNHAGRETPAALPFCLDMHRLSALTADERRSFLFALTGIEITGDSVLTRLRERGCNMAMAEEVKPMLRSGFPAAAEYARKKATEGKGAWKATAGGETWGKDKGGRWRAEKPVTTLAKLDEARAALAKVSDDIEAEATRMGELRARAAQAMKLDDLREKAGRYARIADKLQRDEAEMKDWLAKVDTLRGSRLSQDALPCPCCGVMLVQKDGALAEAASMARGTDDDLSRLPEYERSLALMQSAVANGRRDLEAADGAAKALAELEAAGIGNPTDAKELAGLEAKIDSLKQSRKAQEHTVHAAEEAARQADQADQATAKAGIIHKAILEWLAVAEALEPSGIPGELLAEALRPINDRLRHAAEVTGWLQTAVGADMAITAGGRPYALLSESEQWRVDATLTEAVSHISGLRLLILDRLDVLDMPGRSAALLWLHGLAAAGDLDTGILLATLKSLPAGLPDTFNSYWLDAGRVVEMKAAA